MVSFFDREYFFYTQFVILILILRFKRMEYDCTFFSYNDHFVKKNYVWVNVSILLVHFWTSKAYFSFYQFLVDMIADKSSDDPSKVDHVSYHGGGIEDDIPDDLFLDI